MRKVTYFGLIAALALSAPTAAETLSNDSIIALAKAGLSEGVDSKYTIHYQTDEIGKGIYKISIDKGLDAGEYAFVFTGTNGNSRIYGFSITTALPKSK